MTSNGSFIVKYFAIESISASILRNIKGLISVGEGFGVLKHLPAFAICLVC